MKVTWLTVTVHFTLDIYKVCKAPLVVDQGPNTYPGITRDLQHHLDIQTSFVATVRLGGFYHFFTLGTTKLLYHISNEMNFIYGSSSSGSRQTRDCVKVKVFIILFNKSKNILLTDCVRFQGMSKQCWNKSCKQFSSSQLRISFAVNIIS